MISLISQSSYYCYRDCLRQWLTFCISLSGTPGSWGRESVNAWSQRLYLTFLCFLIRGCQIQSHILFVKLKTPSFIMKTYTKQKCFLSQTHTCKSHKMFPIVRSLEQLTLTLGTGASILAVLRCFLLILSSRRDLIGGLGWTGVRAPPELGVVGVRVRVESLLVGVVGVWLPKLLGLKSEEWCFDRVKFLMGSSGGGLLISW